MSKDLRPLVSRNASNGISLAEAYRDQIYAWFEEQGRAEGVELLLVKSPPLNPTVWVAVEAWLPVGAPAVTKRSRVDIELVPRDFCRWPIEFEIVLRESSRTRAYLGVVDFSSENAAALLRHLLGQSPGAKFGFKYCRVRLDARNKPETTIAGYHPDFASRLHVVLVSPLQLWRPRNRPTALRPDVIGRVPILLLLFAAVGYIGAPAPGGVGTGSAFLVHLIAGALIVGAALYLLDIDLLRAWQFLSGTRAAADQPANPAVASQVDAAAGRDVRGVVALTIMFVLSLFLLDRTVNQVVFWGLAAVVSFLNRYRHRLIWSSGRPEAEPRTLLRMDSWQALLIGLGAERDAVHDTVVAELRSTADTSWSVVDERIWYWSIDGKEERQQTVVSFRSALAFLHFNAYGGDLYVAWDAHINRGIWIEKVVGSGTSAESGALCEVRTIAPGHRVVSEYDVSDTNCVLERVHAVVTRVLRRKLAEHRLDQEIDFTIVREARTGLTGGDGERRGGGPKLFRRKA